MSAVVAEGRDAGVAWHYGNPMAEQRMLETGHGLVDLSHRGVLSVFGPDRLTWLHSLTTQDLQALAPGVGVTAYLLSAHGHIEHALYGVDDGETFWVHTEPGRAADLVGFLDRMRFLLRVEVADRTADLAVVWHAADEPVGPGVFRRGQDSLGGGELLVPRPDLPRYLADRDLAGTWAHEARRIAGGVPRIGVDTDDRTIPNEIGVPTGGGGLGAAVHLDKGCYRGQETVARVHNLGRPPRRLVRLHLDGTEETLPEPGSPVLHGSAVVGFVGSAARHYELGPVALGLVKRSTPIDADLAAGAVPAGQEVLVDPEVGLHLRARL